MSIRDLFPIDKWHFKSEAVMLDLPAAEANLLLLHKTEKYYRRGELVFREGAYPDSIFYIVSGKIKKYKLDAKKKEYIIYIANAGELLGYHAVLAEERYPDSTAALEDSLLISIPRETFLHAVQASETLSKRLLKNLSHEFGVMENNLSLFAQKPVKERLALQLVVLREKYKVNFIPGMLVEINMSREDLANLVGTAREHVVRLLAEFKEVGILETRGRTIIIRDVKKLIKIADYR